jgi:hypothetical protein
VGIAKDRTIPSDYGYPRTNLTSQIFSQSIKVISAFLANETWKAGFSGNPSLVLQLGAQTTELATPDRAGQIRTQSRHTDDDKENKPDSYAPLNTSEQFQPSNL